MMCVASSARAAVDGSGFSHPASASVTAGGNFFRAFALRFSLSPCFVFRRSSFFFPGSFPKANRLLKCLLDLLVQFIHTIGCLFQGGRKIQLPLIGVV